MVDQNEIPEGYRGEESSQFRIGRPFRMVNPSVAFATDAGYMDGKVFRLCFTGAAVDADSGEILKDDHDVWLGLGKGWTSVDGGKSVVHEVGKTEFNKSSGYWAAIEHCLEDADSKAILYSRGSPRNASVWQGLTIDFAEVDLRVGKDEKTGDPRYAKFEIPVALSEGTGKGSGNGTGDLEATLLEIAKTADDFEDFKDKAMDAGADKAGKDFLKTRVLKESGIWAEARA